MTSAGQCRLSPLIPLIQDSSHLYDFLVRLMFKLHSNLPNDVLAGERLSGFGIDVCLTARRFSRSPGSLSHHFQAAEGVLHASEEFAVLR